MRHRARVPSARPLGRPVRAEQSTPPPDKGARMPRTPTGKQAGRQASTRAKSGAAKSTRRRALPAAAAPARGRLAQLPDGPPDATGLTTRQRRVLEVIRDSVERRGYPPSMREIGEAVGLTSTSSVAHQLASLERQGFLRRDPNRPRAVEVRIPVDPDVDEEARRAAQPAAA